LRVSVGDREPRYVVKVRSAAAPRGIAAAVASYLAHADVPGVVAPIPSLAGAVSAETDDASITVYPFVDGQGGIDMQMSDGSWRALGSFARRLHATALPPELRSLVPHETYRPPEIDTIRLVDGAIDETGGRDAIADAVVELWRSHREEILALAARTETLGQALRSRSLPLVICHADMHNGNVNVDRDGKLWIIDWDDVVLAPKERDLMFAIGGGISANLVDANATDRFVEGYGSADADGDALAYFRHAWAVQDVGSDAWRALLDAEATDDQRDDAARILTGLFRPGEIVDLARRSIGVG
jgi:spectinomycin phosphotransferase